MPGFDYILIGGGLQNALLTLAIAQRQPSARIALVERGASLGGNHTWCFHEADVSDAMRAITRPLVTCTWPEHEVRFPGRHRVLASAYHSVTSERLHHVVENVIAERTGHRLYLGRAALRVEPNAVELDDGSVIEARCVIDARGPDRLGARRVAGYQKFLGLELELAEPSAVERPLLMDACVPQHDGFRFVYVLPFEPRRLLVEDTYFSESPELDRPALRTRVLEYALSRGWSIRSVLREETGVLPLPAELSTPSFDAPLLAGYQGGWFHPTTGYSFPVSARLAEFVASRKPGALHGDALALFAREHGRQARFALLLNRLLFDAFAPEARWNVFERFYGLPEETIQRFYALRTTPWDRTRILCGRPPRGLSLSRVVRRGMHP